MLKSKKRKKTTSGIVKPLLIIGGILVGLYCLTAFLVMPLYTRHWQRAHVPDVTNLSMAAAEKIIKHNKLEPMRGEVKYDDLIPAGYVSFQNPMGDTYVKKGRRVYLTTSKGKRPVLVPNLVGTNLRDVRFNVVQHQLELGQIAWEFDRYYPENVVMEQAIEPDIEIPSGSQLDITVSMGEEPTTAYIPNLYGKTLEQAELLIKKALLTKGRTRYSESAKLANTVIYQSIEPGQTAVKGDTINISLSKIAKGQEARIPW